MPNTPIFIGGQMKSGTTMLRMLLSNHTNIFSGLETYWFNRGLTHAYSEKTNIDIEKIKKFYSLSNQEIDLIINATIKNQLPFVNNLLNFCASRAGKLRWLEKTPDNVLHYDLIRKLWPESKFIHVIRNFKDIYASWKISKKHNLSYFIAHVETCYRNIDHLLGTASNHYFEVKYEDLVLNREYSMRNIVKYLNEPFEPSLLELDNERAKHEFEVVLNFTGKKSNTLMSTQQQVNHNKIGQYRRILTQEECNIIDTKLANYIDKYSY
jgi:hypothetical protein